MAKQQDHDVVGWFCTRGNRIDGLGHAWTKKEVDTTGVMWQFFKEPSSESIAGFSFGRLRR